MPKLDGTGPAGKGPKTGAQKGNCQNTNPEENRPFDGRGQGVGFGRSQNQQNNFARKQGRGFVNRFFNRTAK